jgi:hypothetical protein
MALAAKYNPDLINGRGISDVKMLGKPLCLFREHACAMGYQIQVDVYTGVLIGARDSIRRDFTFWGATKQSPFEVHSFAIPSEKCLSIWQSICAPDLSDHRHSCRSKKYRRIVWIWTKCHRKSGHITDGTWED